jgi:hypothetical protein
MVLEYLKSGKILTPIDALNLFGCFRLAGRIYELKDKGWPIKCERREVDSGKRIGHYSMTLDEAWWPDV